MRLRQGLPRRTYRHRQEETVRNRPADIGRLDTEDTGIHQRRIRLNLIGDRLGRPVGQKRQRRSQGLERRPGAVARCEEPQDDLTVRQVASGAVRHGNGDFVLIPRIEVFRLDHGNLDRRRDDHLVPHIGIAHRRIVGKDRYIIG